MQLKVFTIRDSKAEVFNPPFCKHTHGEAERDFTSVANDEKSMVSKYPEDYDLYHIGTYDDQTGKIESLPTPEHMLKAVQVKRPVNAMQ